ncbi:MAG: leucine-rich repeat domain-containing protein, partial [Lachnospiraceae bacterium]|nr:leucine-rich repeat domain-containing protein [Lachnospiraceae bacterium]
MEVSIPNSVTNMGAQVFQECSSLDSIKLPDNLSSIEERTFYECSSLASITIPEQVEIIKETAFWGCKSLTQLKIPSSVKQIERSAFGDCSGLESISIPDSAGISDMQAVFSGCSSLKNIRIPKNEKTTRIADTSFCNCSRLEYVVIPNTIKFINGYGFEGCDSLTDFYFLGSKEEWEAISKNSGKKYIEGIKVHYNSAGPSDDSDGGSDSEGGSGTGGDSGTDDSGGEPSEEGGKFSISDCRIVLSGEDTDEYVYSGTEKRPAVIVSKEQDGQMVNLTEGTDYEVTYQNNIEPGTATVTVKGIGNYQGTDTIEFTITGDVSAFTVGRDNSSWINHENYIFQDDEWHNYKILNEEHKNLLYRYQSDSQQNALKIAMYKNWFGSCYGMSCAMIYSYMGKEGHGFPILPYIDGKGRVYKLMFDDFDASTFDFDDFNPGDGKHFNCTTCPRDNADFRDLIQYLQLTQYREDYEPRHWPDGFYILWSSKMKARKEFLEDLVNEAQNSNMHKPFVFSFTTNGKEEGHTVVIRGLKEGEQKYKKEGGTEENDYYQIEYCDPNGGWMYNDGQWNHSYAYSLYLLVKEDFSECFSVALGDDGEIHELPQYVPLIVDNDCTYLSYYLPDKMNNCFGNGEKKRFIDKINMVVDTVDSFVIKVQDGIKYKVDGSGIYGIEGILGDGYEYGNCEVIPISGNGGGAFKIKLPATEGITIEQIEGDIDISCCLNDEEFMAVDGKNIDKITMEEEKGVSIEGTNAEYTASIGAKDEENTLVQSEGKVDGEVVYSYNNGRIDIEGENVKDTTITTISGDAEPKQLSESEAAEYITYDETAPVDSSKVDLSECVISGVKDTEYAGSPITFDDTIEVMLGDQLLSKDTDYSLLYK